MNLSGKEVTPSAAFSRRQKIFTPLFAALLLLFLMVVPGSSPAQAPREIKGPVDIEADQLSYDHEKDTYHASGNVIVTFTDGYLVADTLSLDKSTEDVFADGDVFLLSGGDTLEGDRVRFNLATKTGIVYQGKVFLKENNFYLTGDEIRKTGEATYKIRNATATTCDTEVPDWRFTGRELEVTIDGYGNLKHGTFQIANRPVLYTPYLFFPAKTKRQSGFLPPQMGYSKDVNGFDIEVPFFWAISENTDATLYQRYIERRGWKQGVEYRYFLSKDSFGTIYADYLNDSKEISGEPEGVPRHWTGDQKRWSYYISHETTFSPGVYLRTDILKLSDIWYFKDFSSHNYYLENYAGTAERRFQRISFIADRSLASYDSTARFVKTWPLYNLTVLGRYTENLAAASNDATLQSYPLVTFTGYKQPILNSPVNFELSSYYQYAHRNVGEKGHAAEASPTLSLPLSFGDYLQLTPFAGVRGTVWEGRGGPEDKNGSRELYNFGVTAATEAFRIFPVGIGAVDRIRHSVRPEVTYNYIPNTFQGDLPDYVPAVAETNSVTYSLTNIFTAKLREKAAPGSAKTPVTENFSYLEFLRLKLLQTYNIMEARSSRPEPERRPFSPVDIEFDVLPSSHFTYRSLATYDTNDGEWKRFNYDLGVSDNRGDSVIFGYRYTQDAIEEINLSLTAKLTRELDVNYLIRKNVLDGTVLETSYGLTYKRQCWIIDLVYSELLDDRRIIMFVTLNGLGKVGQVQARPDVLRGGGGTQN